MRNLNFKITEEGIAELVYSDWDINEISQTLQILFPNAKEIEYIVAYDSDSIVVKVDDIEYIVNCDGTKTLYTED